MNVEESDQQSRTSIRHEQSEVSAHPAHAGRRRRIIIFLIVGLLNLGLLALLTSQVLNPAQGNTSGSGTNPLIGQPAPDFTLPVLGASSSSTLHLLSLKGRPVILNFWASWCDACKEEAPFLQQTWQRISGQGVLLIGIDSEDTQDAALNFITHYGITYPNVVDGANGFTAINYGVTGFPETVFIDRHGIIIQKEIGPLSQHMLQQDLPRIGVSASAADTPFLTNLAHPVLSEAREHTISVMARRRREGNG